MLPNPSDLPLERDSFHPRETSISIIGNFTALGGGLRRPSALSQRESEPIVREKIRVMAPRMRPVAYLDAENGPDRYR